MISLSQILDIGKKSLSSHQYALSVTGQNIANVNTPGYSRQRAIFQSDIPIDTIPGPVGTGVKIEDIERIRDQFVDTQVKDQLSQVGEWDKSSSLLTEIESILNEPTDTGLSQMISDFFNAWANVSNNPEETGPRRVLVAKAEVLSDTFGRLKEQLQSSITNINKDIEYKVGLINTKAGEIAQLNSQIIRSEAGGQTANDLRDKRDTLVNELASLANVQTVESDDGSIAVYVNYKVIVDRLNTVELTTEMTDRAGVKMRDIMYNGERLEPQSGELHATLYIRDEQIPEYIDKLDTLAGSIIDEVNEVHRGGYGLDGTTAKSFFSGADASSIAVSSEILSDLSLIAASSTGAPGSGNTALELSQLASSLSMNDGTTTFADFYSSTVAEIGATTETAGIMLDNENALLTQLKNYQDSVSGVSLDEEYTNMINYQHGYEAAAKVVSMADSLFGTILGMVGAA
ncbi:MAG: flagellar hook-associated protein FlgK [bacterium]|nr:flagellar hook-associated protein FlgK [bacterium]